MSTEVYNEVEEVDLSKLIGFGMTFEPLQLTLRDILRRLAQLERQNTSQDIRIAQLSASIEDLDEANKALEEKLAACAKAAEKKEETHDEAGQHQRGGGLDSDSDAIWDEIARLNGLLGELQDGAERDRHTIDEIYAARKRHHPKASAVGTREGSAPGGEETTAEEVRKGVKEGASSTAAAAPPPGRTSSVARVSSGAEDIVPAKPVGDFILEKAHESLEFEGTRVYTAFEEAAPTALDAKHLGSVSQEHSQLSQPQSFSTCFASRPTSCGVGGEDAGEHRGSAAPYGAQGSHPVSPVHRRSMYADQRIAAAAARRVSQLSTGRPAEVAPTAGSVFEKLKRDGNDIAYLNRVVAEILGEMKGLHADMDQLRIHQEEADSTESERTCVPAGASNEDLNDMRRRIARVENDVVDTRQQLQRRDDELQEELDNLKKQLRVARSMTDDDLNALRNARDLADRLKQLEERLRALEAAHSALAGQFEGVLAVGEKSEGGVCDINPLQFAALQGAVKNLEKQLADLLAAQGGQTDWSQEIRQLNDAVRAVEGDVEAARDQLQRTMKETSRLEEVKANRSELGNLPPPDSLQPLEGNKRSSSSDGSTVPDLISRMARAETNIGRLNEDKADRSALQKLRDELNAMRQRAELANAQRRDSDSASDTRAPAATEKALRELQADLNILKDAYRNSNLLNSSSNIGGEDMEYLKERIERLDHCKADATLVANKAERDYVENALERLMREVEQVLNATNAGLIDTLEKSLNILRDMIDGKATKQDVANLEGWMAEANGAGAGAGVADGLTGFKAFRCLGCNRPMDSMRPRPQAATLMPFVNRNPQNFPQDNVTRTIQQQQQPRVVGPASSFTAGVRNTGAPVSSSVNLQRSTSSEPLPPIEPS
ncbi:hypothetical protein ABL78_7026 [Leptomonas seymouri]|uniref:Uncharacterized protein n=1 Tax=Leptomonas seymouri TaxID=5684 RepID=A0A0N0P3B0_LEPSE|nr:hypothetical protein ABL78_7026 [Leptomonas seymouri]|eukprot:KPI83926.1 hypothetical protein ABL78_7026 [Leptomonas seymouri]